MLAASGVAGRGRAAWRLAFAASSTSVRSFRETMFLRSRTKNDHGREVGRWVRSTCFSRVGIATPQRAIDHPGCTALLHQFRFGPELCRLANDVIYHVLRDAGELPEVRASASTEIVLVDVSTVPDLAQR